MRIGIIGAGNVGTSIGRRLAERGHALTVSFSRTPAALDAAARAIGAGTATGSAAEAAAYGEVVLLATPWAVTLDVVREIAPALAGKVLWDATNPLLPDMGGLALGTTTSAGEAVASAAAAARVVKAIPPFAEFMAATTTEIGGRRPSVFVCGDDAEARESVLALVADIGADGVDAGPLALARCTEPLGLMLVQLAYGRGLGPRIGAAFLRDGNP